MKGERNNFLLGLALFFASIVLLVLAWLGDEKATAFFYMALVVFGYVLGAGTVMFVNQQHYLAERGRFRDNAIENERIVQAQLKTVQGQLQVDRARYQADKAALLLPANTKSVQNDNDYEFNNWLGD